MRSWLMSDLRRLNLVLIFFWNLIYFRRWSKCRKKRVNSYSSSPSKSLGLNRSLFPKYFFFITWTNFLGNHHFKGRGNREFRHVKIRLHRHYFRCYRSGFFLKFFFEKLVQFAKYLFPKFIHFSLYNLFTNNIHLKIGRVFKKKTY